MVGDRGVKLSGGQRQRIAIARAFLKDAPLLILDEATSALDIEAEEAIRETLESLMAGRTVITIAHRLSTLRNFDRILVLQGGRLVEDGAPDALMRGQGVYHDLVSRELSRLAEQPSAPRMLRQGAPAGLPSRVEVDSSDGYACYPLREDRSRRRRNRRSP
jgi:ATP-binding cassette subfamily B protein